MSGKKAELFNLIREVLAHPLVKGNQVTLYRNYNPGMTEDSILRSESDYQYPSFIIMPHYEAVSQHLAWCRGSFFGKTVEQEIADVRLTLGILNENTAWVLPRPK